MKMKKLTSLALALTMVCSLVLPARAEQGGGLVRPVSVETPAPESTPTPAARADGEDYFDTVGHYAAGAIKTWSDYGVLKGYEDNTFRPDGTITRAELATVLDRVMGYQETAENTFADLPAERWYTDYLLRLAQQGIFNGDEGGKMNPEAPITRQETFAAMARALELKESEEPTGFADEESISAWAKGYISAMKEAGYIQGDQQGNIRANKPITRAEVVSILNKMVAAFVNKDGAYSKDCKGNLFVNAGDVRLKDMTIDGDLIVTDGVADGDVYLEKVTVKGDVILRGCGENSFHILPGCKVEKIIVTKTTKGVIRLVNESGKTIPMVFVNDGKSGVILDGDAFSEVIIACDGPVDIAVKKVKTLSVTKDVDLTINKGTNVSSLILTKTAKNARVTVEGKVTKITNDAGIKVEKKNGGSVGNPIGSSGGSSGGSSDDPGSSTAPTSISAVTLQLLAPAFGNIPDEVDVLGVGYTAEIVWKNADGTEPTKYRWKENEAEKDTFTANQAYQAVVTLSPSSNYVFSDDLKINITDGNENDYTPAKTEKMGNDWIVTMIYEPTVQMPHISDVYISRYTETVMGENVTLSVSYKDNKLVAPNHTYQWYVCSDAEGGSETEIPGATGKSYMVEAKKIGYYYYRCKVTVAGVTYDSNIAGVRVQDPDFGELLPIAIEVIDGTCFVRNLVIHSRVKYIVAEYANYTVTDSVEGTRLVENELINFELLEINKDLVGKYRVDGYAIGDEYGYGKLGQKIIDIKLLSKKVVVTPFVDNKPVEDARAEVTLDFSEDSFTMHLIGKDAVLTGVIEERRPKGEIVVTLEPATYDESMHSWIFTDNSTVTGAMPYKEEGPYHSNSYKSLSGQIYFTYSEESGKEDYYGYYRVVVEDRQYLGPPTYESIPIWGVSTNICDDDLVDVVHIDIHSWIEYSPDTRKVPGGEWNGRDIYMYEVEPTIAFSPKNG